jgi:ATP phosphoribosyltransferase regulatory subunit
VRIHAALPVGVSALLFAAARRRRELEGRFAACLLDAGFEEVILPILDYLEPYEPLLTPAGRGELYRFADRDGELLALRADSTPMLARLLAPRIGSLPLPLRLFYRGDVVRYQEEKPGRAREFYEVGAELLGAPGPEAELEMVSLFLRLLSAAPAVLADVPPPLPLQIVLGFAGALDEVLLAASPADAARLARAVARRQREEVRQSAPHLLAVLEHGLPAHPEDLGPRAAARLRMLEDQVGVLAGRFPEVDFAIDLAEFARQVCDPRLGAATGEGRPYYDGLVFHAYAGAAALPVGGGGRYDALFSRLGATVPALGFAIGLDRLLQSLAPAEEVP